MPVSLNMGMRMPAWYDLYGLSGDSEQDEGGIKTSAKSSEPILTMPPYQSLPLSLCSYLSVYISLSLSVLSLLLAWDGFIIIFLSLNVCVVVVCMSL